MKLKTYEIDNRGKLFRALDDGRMETRNSQPVVAVHDMIARLEQLKSQICIYREHWRCCGQLINNCSYTHCTQCPNIDKLIEELRGEKLEHRWDGKHCSCIGHCCDKHYAETEEECLRGEKP